jgi:glycosyltransferase involved in cell wall biosynthesis
VRSWSRSPLVSVVIPTFERPRMLAQALDSVLAQDHQPLEVIVCDDGSGAETQALLDDWEAQDDPRLRVDRHLNLGFVPNLNRGLQLARGELVGIVPDDDLLRPGALTSLVAALAARPEAVLAYSGYDVIDDTGAVADTVSPIDFSLAEALRLYWMTVPGAGALWRRSVAQRIGGWDEELRWCSDFDFWLRLGLEGPFTLVREPLAAKRRHAGAYSSAMRGPEKARERVLMVERFCARPDLSEEVLAVRDEAFRAAYIDAGISAAPGLNRPGERFYVADLLAPRLGGQADADAEGRAAELSLWIRRLEQQLEERDARIAELENPLWMRIWRAAVPRAVRRAAWRTMPALLRRIRSGSSTS